MANWTGSASLSILALVIGICDWIILPHTYANVELIIFIFLLGYNIWLTRYLIHNGNPKKIPRILNLIDAICLIAGCAVIFVLPSIY